MTTYNVTMRGEDHTVFTRSCEASSPEGAMDWADELWPEATVLEVFDPSVRAQDVYDRVRREMDDDYYYDD